MIGHGKKDHRPELNQKYREECLISSSRSNCHEHVKKDLQMITKYPQTIRKLEDQGNHIFSSFRSSLVSPAAGDTKNEIRRAQVDIQVKEASVFSHKLYQYYKWYSSKSPAVRNSI
jgi:protein subunit release factor A